MGMVDRERTALLRALGLLAVLLLSACSDNLPPLPPGAFFSHDPVIEWNSVMLDFNAVDHGLRRPDQGGPVRTARAFAIVQLAVYDALNAIERRGTPYAFPRSAPFASAPHAVAAAAYHTLRALYPAQQERLEPYFHEFVSRYSVPGKGEGLALGTEVAAHLIGLRAFDGSQNSGSYSPPGGPGYHDVDPINPGQGFGDPAWGLVTPFAVPNIASFRSPPPPPLGSAAYAQAYQEVALLGGDGTATFTQRTPEQTLVGLYWAYDGSPGIGTPPRLYNQIAQVIAASRGNTSWENARLFGLVNLAMADAGIQCWDSKYYYAFWRPILGIRYGSDPFWTPYGAPLSNMRGNNFTPNFPAYPSGHATFGAALFRTLARFYGTDHVPFTFVSDELNGVTTDNFGVVRPRVPRTFQTLSQAEEENGQSRIYLGIHWSFDKTAGIQSGRAIADYVFTHTLRPLF